MRSVGSLASYVILVLQKQPTGVVYSRKGDGREVQVRDNKGSFAAGEQRNHIDSCLNTQEYWANRAKNLVTWEREWDTVLAGDFTTNEIHWFPGAKLNVCYNCLDRHIERGRRNTAALVWQGEDEDEVKVYTYQMLHSAVCKFANVLKKKGVCRGDSVTIYLPMVPELVISMLACARIGAVHCVVFSGFSPASLQTRMQDCQSKLLITADAVKRSGRTIPLKANAEEPLDECHQVTHCIVVQRTKRDIAMKPERDSWWHEEVDAADISSSCDAETMDADDPLFVLYTSGSTGSPKGVVHTTGGYLLYVLHTCQLVFGLQDDDTFWCTADIGWITGHSYGIYGPLGLGGTSLIYEGIPLYPEPDRYWQIVEKFRVTIFYTAPTVIRALMRFGRQPIEKHDISSLRLLGTVGEPISSKAWEWYHQHIGNSRLPIVNTWWQTESGGIMIAPLPYSKPVKPGSVAGSLPGIDAAVINESGREAAVDEGGRLVIRKPWPGMLKGLFGERAALKKNYLEVFPGVYDTGDGARRDKDGFFWMTGRVDDVINVSGHRLGTAEVESALLMHKSVAEAAVVGVPHPLKGQAIYAYVTVNKNVEKTEDLLEELRRYVGSKIGPIASPETIQYAVGLPKTRSGKIMRRLLKRIAADDFDNFGDISSLADPSLLADLIEKKKEYDEDPEELGYTPGTDNQ